MKNFDVWYSRIDVDEIAQAAAEQASRKERVQFERNIAKARSKDSMKAFAKLTTIVDGEPRIAADPPLIIPIEDIAAAIGQQRHRSARARSDPLLPADVVAGSPAVAGALPLRARGAQGRRRRQRRHARLDRVDARPRRQRPAVPAAQGGAGLGARAVPGQERLRPARPARRRGSAADAGRQRHHARLDPPRRRRTASSGTSTCASCGTARAPPSSRR